MSGAPNSIPNKDAGKKFFGFLPAKVVPYVVVGAFLLLGYEFYGNVMAPAASEGTTAHSGQGVAQ